MKKFLAIALIAASFTACNDGEKSETTTTDTTTVVTTPETPAPDTATVVTTTTTTTDTVNKMSGDNKMSADTMKKGN